MKERGQTGGGARAASLAFVLAASALGAWIIYGHAPVPSGGDVEDEAAAEAPAPTPEPAEKPAECCGEGEPPAGANAGQDFMSGLFPVTASGRAGGSRTEFLDGLEKTYRLRGYKSLGEVVGASVKAGRRNPQPRRFYWRYEPEAPAPAIIGATGPDADPHSDAPTPRPASFSTMVTSDGAGGVEWTTFRRDLPADFPAAGAAPDFDAEAPGLDPPGVPRPPGLTRRFSSGGRGDGRLIAFYTSSRPAVELVSWYAANMPPNWEYAPDASAQARAVSEGAMCFMRGRQFCLVWIADGEGGGPTSVIVSVKG